MGNVLCYANEGKRKGSFRRGVDDVVGGEGVWAMGSEQGEYICYVEVGGRRGVF